MPATVTTAVLAGVFLGSLGINTHLDFKRHGYQDLDKVEDAIRYLGVSNIRDSARRSSTLQSWPRISRATGAKFTHYMTTGSPADMEDSYNLIVPLAATGTLNFIEGGNQQDSPYAISRGNSIAYTAHFQRQLYRMGQSLGLPVINMSFGAGWTADNNWKGNYDKAGDLSAYADYGNAHTYPKKGQKTGVTIRRLNDLAKLAAATRPVIITEIGWDEDAGFTQNEIAKNISTAAFDSWTSGATKVFFYALYDDDSGHYGLMNSDGTPKPAGTALHNLTTLLADKSSNVDSFKAGALAYRIEGSGSESSLLLQKSDGAYWVALWDETQPPRTVSVNFTHMAATVDVYDPLMGTQPIQSSKETRRVSLKLPGHPLLVRVVPALESLAEKDISRLSAPGVVPRVGPHP